MLTGAEDLSFGPPQACGTTPPDVPLYLPRLQGATKAGLKGLKVGVYPAWFNDAEDSIVESSAAAVETMKQLGAEMVELSIPDLELCRVAHTVTLSSDSLQVRFPAVEHTLAPLSVLAFSCICVGLLFCCTACRWGGCVARKRIV